MVAEVPKKNAGGGGMPRRRRHGRHGFLIPACPGRGAARSGAPQSRIATDTKRKTPAAMPGFLFG